MKDFIVIRKNDLFAGQVCESFDTLTDAILYRDLMSRNETSLQTVSLCGITMCFKCMSVKQQRQPYECKRCLSQWYPVPQYSRGTGMAA